MFKVILHNRDNLGYPLLNKMFCFVFKETYIVVFILDANHKDKMQETLQNKRLTLKNVLQQYILRKGATHSIGAQRSGFHHNPANSESYQVMQRTAPTHLKKLGDSVALLLISKVICLCLYFGLYLITVIVFSH